MGIIQAIQALNYDVLMARDRTRTMFLFSLFLTASHLVAFSVGLEWGVVGVAVAYAISTTLVEPFQTVLAARCLGVSPMVFFRALAGVFQAGFVMCAIVLAVRVSLVDAGVPPGAAPVHLRGRRRARVRGLRAPEIAAEVRGVLRRRRGAAPPIAPAAAAAER